MSLRHYGDSSFSGPFLFVYRDSLGTPAVTGQPVEDVGLLVHDGGVNELSTVVLVDEHHDYLRLDVGRRATHVVLALLITVARLLQFRQDVVVSVRLLLTRNLQRLVDADSCTET